MKDILAIIILTLRATLLMRPDVVEAFRRATCPVRPDPPREAVDALVARADRVLLFKVFGKLVFRTRCVKRSIVLYWYLRKNGYPAEARIGFLKSQGELLGHAWITVDGRPVPEPPFAPKHDFTPFFIVRDSIEVLRHA